MSEHWHESGAAAAYVSGDMPDESLDAFEEHLLGCAECRAEIVAGGAATAELRLAPVRVKRRWPVARLAVVATAAAAVVLVAWRESARLRLARIDAPEFVGTTVRASAEAAVPMIDSAMQAYAAADFAAAGRLLARAANTDSSPAVAFYLGVSLLKAGQADAALAALLRARQPARNPYADEATLFAAKALVRLRQRDSALALIRRTAGQGALSVELRAFADSLARR